MQVTRKQRRLTDVGRAGQPRDPSLEPDREPAVRRHPVAKRLQVAGERLRIEPTGSERRQVVLVAVQALAARRQLEPAEQQVEAVGVLRIDRIGVGVERSFDHRVAGHEYELGAVLAGGPVAQPALVRGREVRL